MAHDSQVMADRPLDAIQEQQVLRAALLESVSQLADDAQRFTPDWQGQWADPAIEQEVTTLSVALLEALEGLLREFGRAEEPSQARVAQLLGALLGTPDQPGPLNRLQQVFSRDSEGQSLNDQRRRSEVDALVIQLEGLRAQWQEYLSVATAGELERPRHPTQPLEFQEPPLSEAPVAAPLPDSARRSAAGAAPSFRLPAREHPQPAGPFIVDHLLPPQPAAGGELRQGAGSTLRVMLVLMGVLLLVVGVAYAVVTLLPDAASQSSRRPGVGPSPSAPPATLAPEPTNTPLPTATPSATATPTTSPSATSAPGAGQLSVNPTVLLVPCPGEGAATLQLINTGSTPLDWQATPSSASGGNPGVLLDGSPSASGYLNPSQVALVSVSARTQHDQGTITITATGASHPLTVTYTINC